MDFHTILSLVYEIQGTADPEHGAETLPERMAEIYAVACRIMDETGFQPDPLETE